MGRRLAVTILVGITAAMGCSSSSKAKTIARYDWSGAAEQLRAESTKAATEQCATEQKGVDSRACILREAEATFAAELPKRRQVALAKVCAETHPAFVQLIWVDFQRRRITQAFNCP
jgi:hypothetical protein